uniref:Guanylate kinase-like domain-containing protein n=1 Tax=Macrostomum lignano TaxID=282301 RepID=A0A1I8FQA8_9PLAT
PRQEERGAPRSLEASQASAVRLRQQQQPASSRLLQQSHLAESALRICDPNYPNSGRRNGQAGDLDSDNPDSGMSTLRDVPDLEVEDAANNWAAAARRRSRDLGTAAQIEQQQRFWQQEEQPARHFPPAAAAQPLNSESEAGEDAAEEELYRLRERSVSRQVAQNFDEDADEAAGLDCLRHSGSPSSPGRVTDSRCTQSASAGHSAITTVPRRDRRVAGRRAEVVGRSRNRVRDGRRPLAKSVDIVARLSPCRATPERMFKVVLAGDAAVGKSKLHHEALWEHAQPGALPVRCHSPTFRRADGVLLSYSTCTYERSFLSVRENGSIRCTKGLRTESVPIMDLLEQDGLEDWLPRANRASGYVEYTEARKAGARVNRANVRLGKDDDKGKNAKEKSACCDF